MTFTVPAWAAFMIYVTPVLMLLAIIFYVLNNSAMSWFEARADAAIIRELVRNGVREDEARKTVEAARAKMSNKEML